MNKRKQNERKKERKKRRKEKASYLICLLLVSQTYTIRSADPTHLETTHIQSHDSNNKTRNERNGNTSKNNRIRIEYKKAKKTTGHLHRLASRHATNWPSGDSCQNCAARR
jgi:hypothetical protein